MNVPLRRALILGFLIGVPLFFLLFGTALGWIGHNLIDPPGKVASVSLYNNWRVGCPALSEQKGACTMQLPVTEVQSGGTVANLLIGHSPTGLKLVVTLPLDVLIVPGMGIVLGNDKMRGYRFETCTSAGCIATISLSDPLITSLDKAKKAQILFAMPTAKKPVSLGFSLEGFSQAYAAFVEDDARRHSWWRRMVS
jgi:invasion protein IalB